MLSLEGCSSDTQASLRTRQEIHAHTVPALPVAAGRRKGEEDMSDHHMIGNAACAAQNTSLIDDPVTFEAIQLNIINPLRARMVWHDGAPTNPWDREWFIAQTTYGDRVVLKALPEDFSYDFKTADDTYIMRDKIRKWMQFPDSNYLPCVTEEQIDLAMDAWLDQKGSDRAAMKRAIAAALEPKP